MKRMLISGGTSTIGRAAVAAFVEEGWYVYLGYHTNKEGAETLATEYPTSVQAIHVNLQDSSTIEVAIEKIPSLDLLINNSGIFSEHLTKDLTEGEFTKTFDVNVTGVFRLTKALLPKLKSGSAIINIASINALVPTFGSTAHYDASKGAIISYTRSLAQELAPAIRVNALAPGLIQAPYLDEKNEIRKIFERRALLKRLVKPDEVANTLLFMATNTALTGAVITLDCGYAST
ncbi:MAG: SDR family oxidoreductase [Sphaerochaeta sp.]